MNGELRGGGKEKGDERGGSGGRWWNCGRAEEGGGFIWWWCRERESEWGGGLTLTLTITKITGMSEGGRKKKERKVRKNEGKKVINFLINYSECMHDTCPYYLL